MAGWIGVDLDGTLAEWHGGAVAQVGKPVPAMLARVKRWLDEGQDVRIFTARVSSPIAAHVAEQKAIIAAWCKEHLGRELEVTCKKDFGMIELWDDRATEVRVNTGEPVNVLKRSR